MDQFTIYVERRSDKTGVIRFSKPSQMGAETGEMNFIKLNKLFDKLEDFCRKQVRTH